MNKYKISFQGNNEKIHHLPSKESLNRFLEFFLPHVTGAFYTYSNNWLLAFEDGRNFDFFEELLLSFDTKKQIYLHLMQHVKIPALPDVQVEIKGSMEVKEFIKNINKRLYE